MLFFEFSFPFCADDAANGLFFRADEVSSSCARGGRVSSDTYFNGVPLSVYAERCGMSFCEASVRLSGSGTLRWMLRSGRRRQVLARQTFSSGKETVLSYRAEMRDLPPHSVLYFEAEGEVCVLGGGCRTDMPGRRVSLRLVFCTYRRERELRANIGRIAPVLGEDMQVFVVDNGKTLGNDFPAYVTLIPNRNLGGSGGYARGMAEAMKDADATHVLLMDDDIEVHPAVLKKTAALLALCKDPSVNIGGSMLSLAERTAVRETGGHWDGFRLRARAAGADVSSLRGLERNARASGANYQAWWYMAIPLDTVRREGLPMPMFIKSDDIEYSLRIRTPILTMNGIGVWHADFGGKFRPPLNYYIKRNELILNAVTGCRRGQRFAKKRLLYSFAKNLLLRNAEARAYVLRAYEDFLNGAEAFARSDAEQLNAVLFSSAPDKSEGSVRRFFAVRRRLKREYAAAAESFRAAKPFLVSEEYWGAAFAGHLTKKGGV